MARLHRLLPLTAVLVLAVACARSNLNSEEPLQEYTKPPFAATLPATPLSTQEDGGHTSSSLKLTPTLSPTVVSPAQRPSSNLEQYTIELKAGTFDPLVKPLPLPETLTLDAYPPEEGYYIIQFDGPILDEWQHDLDMTGAKRMGYVSHYAYLVRMTADQRKEAEALPHLRWIGLYQPGYKISPDLSGQLEGRSKITILTFPETDIKSIGTRIKEWGGVVEDISENQYAGTILADFDMQYIAKLARLPGVMWIEPWSRPVLQ